MAGPLAAAAPYIATGIAALGGAMAGKNESSKRTEKLMRLMASSGFEPSPTNRVLQNLLPSYLQSEQIGPSMTAAFQNIGQLLQRPGSLSPVVADAVRQRQAMESEQIAQNFRGLGAEQVGAASRSNAPVSIKNALQSALGIAQERAQRESRRGALMESEELRRKDLQQVYPILESILAFLSSARGQSIQGLQAAQQSDDSRSASNLALIGSLMSSLGSMTGKPN